MENFDAIVIGSGQGGGPLAGALAMAGKRVVIFERANVGGTCINTGCTPTKAMVGSAQVAESARNATRFGVHARNVTVNMREVRARKQGIVDQFRGGSERALVSKPGLELVRAEASFIGPRQVRAAEREFTAPWVFLNTGCRALVPDIAGIHDVPYLDNASIMELDSVPQHLIVVGGSYIACEFGQMFRRFGADVTILTRDAQLLPREDADIADCMRAIFEQDAIRMEFNANVESARKVDGGVEIGFSGKTVRGSHVLLAAGRVPNTEALHLDKAGIKTDKHGFIVANERLETSAEGVWAIGDVKGGPQFTHISYDDFRILRDNLLRGGKRTTGDRMVPYTVFTDPQVGRIGMSEAEARRSGKKLAIATMPASSIARATEVGNTRGMLKIIVDRDTDQILGAAMVCGEGGEMAAMVELAMIGKLTCRQIQDFVFSHPTWSESLNNLVGRLQDV